MEIFHLSNLSFSYPGQSPCLRSLHLEIPSGQFITLCGKSGCGKSTLLRLLKPTLAPHGTQTGDISFLGAPLHTLTLRQQAEKIGFVQQDPEHQLVTDKVWHELAFGLESLGLPSDEIRRRVSEMANFFGIQTWFHRSVATLSGGQKQLVNLASVMVMQPDTLLLDEPTSQLDPIAAASFLATLAKLNREFGTTMIVAEHRLEDTLPLSDRVIVLDAGQVIVDAAPREAGQLLGSMHHPLFAALPTPLRVASTLSDDVRCPITVCEGQQWLRNYAAAHPLRPLPTQSETPKGNRSAPALELADVWFKYERETPDVLRGLSLSVDCGERFAIVGGNGAGKSTMMAILSGLLRPYRGSVRWNEKLSEHECFRGTLGFLPQNPQTLFVGKTVLQDLREVFDGTAIPEEEQHRRLQDIIVLCQLQPLLSRHPYDLSGGEQQRAALGKMLLLQPKILLLDEPTKGLDSAFKERFAKILRALTLRGVTIVLVSHDIEFCARHATRCAMLFDGQIVSEASPRRFFSGNRFYTTAAHRMATPLLPDAITAEDLITACGGKLSVSEETPHPGETPAAVQTEDEAAPPLSSPPISLGRSAAPAGGKPVSSFRRLCGPVTVLLLIPATVYAGLVLLDDRKYYFISLLIVLEAFFPFALAFERRRPQAREVIVLAVMIALAVTGRAAFFMLPQCKPTVAIIILAGVGLGAESGFLAGAMSAFISNFFFGQGPWTPWQMFALGCIGFMAGRLSHTGFLPRRKLPLSAFGMLSALLIYGGIMDTANVLMVQAVPSWGGLLVSWTLGLPFNLILAIATLCFLLLFSEPMLEKLTRIQVKYHILCDK